MIRFTLPLILLSSMTFAAEVAVPGYGIPGEHSKKAIDQEASNIACASESSVKLYAASAAVEKMTRHPLKVNPPKNFKGKKINPKGGYSMLAVRLNLKANDLLVKTSRDEIDSYYDDDSDMAQADHPAIPGTVPVPRAPKDADPWLYNNGFVNLLDCPKWRDIMLDAKNLPKGAVIVYAGGHSGKIEIKTPSGFWSDTTRTDSGFAKGMKVMGVYIKPTY
ncbi:MAG: hypothetical protein ACXVA9_13745 [Bdellovibrionales bacterium]